MTTCPTCDGAVYDPLLGRPRRYCSASCRREMARLRAQLHQLETDLVRARHSAETHYSPTWRAKFARDAAHFEPLVAQLRERIPEELQ